MKIRRGLTYAGFLFAIVGAMTLLSTCGNQYALLLTIRGQKANYLVEVFDLRVKDLGSGETILERIGEKVDPSDPNRDISEPGKELKIAIEFGGEGNYLVYLLGRSGAGTEGAQFALRDYHVDSVLEEAITLNLLVEDKDGDGFPKCGPQPGVPPPGISCPPVSCKYLDCNDDDENIHPFAKDFCGDKVDQDCSAGCWAAKGEGDAECTDNDKDGVPSSDDCDDDDPCKSPLLKEAKNLCGTTAEVWNAKEFEPCKQALAAEGKEFKPPFCGDGIDQDCNGSDAACFTDNDCDGYSPPNDCKDDNPKINPGATEECDKVDNNCDGTVDEGCMPCDVDGDQHAATNYQGGECPDLPRDDPDDYDAGIYPGSTKDTGDLEGGSVLGALREFCSATKQDKNGNLYKDVDHDGDGTPASGDGCPPANCDGDGDGFQGAQCSPPKSKEDCDDTDPHTFPGAPDLCGDGKAQNCVADKDCSCDTDGDKYCGADDCNTGDGAIHPWATEICDKKDNDCDKLVDEGNPDDLGNPIRTELNGKRYSLCNDDNDGICAPPCTGPGPNDCHNNTDTLSGICACSPVDTAKIYKHDPSGNRVACAGENPGAPASPRCFDSLRPDTESCAFEDRDCDGHDFVKGQPFKDKGKACSINAGTCQAGTVDDCDLNVSIPNAALVQKIMDQQNPKVEFNEHWVCSPGTLFPVPEVCNGWDDNCDDKKLPLEVDIDGDKHLACGPCTKGSGRTDLNPAYDNCSDCNDLNGSIHLGAQEICNDVDDNCVNGKSDDGQDQCPPLSCCSSQKACRNLGNDFQNCGSCGNVCPSTTTSACTNGSCVCGGSAGPCTGNLNCVSGSCQCIQNGLCGGCCDGNTCLPGNTVAKCGDNGAACQTCQTSNPCKNPVCASDGTCTTSNKSNGTACSVSGNPGQCYGGDCCTGCWNSGCQPGGDVANCGLGGVDCSQCTGGTNCQTPTCSAGTCTYPNKPPTTACTSGGNPGQCYGGNCCTGCWSTSTSQCLPGNSNIAACGSGGNSCLACTDPGDCVHPTCNGACGVANDSPGTPCTVSSNPGTCLGGACCAGCWAGTSCISSPTAANCGAAGGSCTTCGGGQYCNNGTCDCNSTSCSSGCCEGTACRSGTTDQLCGSNGQTCVDCTNADLDCVSHVCECTAGGNCAGCCDDSTTCLPGNTTADCGSGGVGCFSCGSGQTCSGSGCVCNATSCPAGCCNGNTCVPYASQSDGECGTGGAACTGCASDLDCNNGACECVAGGNCGGCCSGNTCMPGDTDEYCGDNGDPCDACVSPATCGPPGPSCN